jgi:hypothetical protein
MVIILNYERVSISEWYGEEKQQNLQHYLTIIQSTPSHQPLNLQYPIDVKVQESWMLLQSLNRSMYTLL